MIKDIEFLQLFAAKLFHDLAGTLGAINSAIEFVNSNDPEVRQKAIELMDLSTVQTTDKLKFLRYAYGISKHDGEADLSNIKKLCMLLAKDKKIEIDFFPISSLTNDKLVDVTTGQLILCLAALAKSALIHGGIVSIAIDSRGRKILTVSAQGKTPKVQSEAHDIINGNQQIAINPTNIHAYYIRRLIESYNIKLDIKTNPDIIQYIISLKQQ